jgi:hypothetical protein
MPPYLLGHADISALTMGHLRSKSQEIACFDYYYLKHYYYYYYYHHHYLLYAGYLHIYS